MPVNYPSCRRIFMNFGNFWVQEKKIHVTNCRFWGGKLEFLFFGTLTFWGDSNFWVLLIILPWGWTGLNHLLWTPAACEQLVLVSQMPFWICLSCSLFLGVKAFLWNSNFWEAPSTGISYIQKVRVPFFWNSNFWEAPSTGISYIQKVRVPFFWNSNFWEAPRTGFFCIQKLEFLIFWKSNFWEAPRTGFFCIQKVRVPFFLEL